MRCLRKSLRLFVAVEGIHRTTHEFSARVSSSRDSRSPHPRCWYSLPRHRSRTENWWIRDKERKIIRQRSVRIRVPSTCEDHEFGAALWGKCITETSREWIMRAIWICKFETEGDKKRQECVYRKSIKWSWWLKGLWAELGFSSYCCRYRNTQFGNRILIRSAKHGNVCRLPRRWWNRVIPALQPEFRQWMSTEQCSPNGRETRSSTRPERIYRVDRKWGEYQRWCDHDRYALSQLYLVCFKYWTS